MNICFDVLSGCGCAFENAVFVICCFDFQLSCLPLVFKFMVGLDYGVFGW